MCAIRSNGKTVSCAKSWSKSKRSQQYFEAFLCEVKIMRQYLGNPQLAHGSHGYAVRQAVFLVRTSLVQGQTRQE